MNRKVIAGILIVLLLGAYLFLHSSLYSQLTVVVPAYQAPPEQLVHMDQGWSLDQQLQFHHTAQGTRLVPYDWLIALEQPCFSLIGCELFADKTYLGRFGF